MLQQPCSPLHEPLCLTASPRTDRYRYPKEFPDAKVDKDDPTYQNWVYQRAAARAQKFSIAGVTLMHTQGVIKNIIPAIASTNAIVAAACAVRAASRGGARWCAVCRVCAEGTRFVTRKAQ